MGPGPSNVHPRVLHAMGLPVLGHLDPEFLGIMNLTKDLLAKTVETGNEFTICSLKAVVACCPQPCWATPV